MLNRRSKPRQVIRWLEYRDVTKLCSDEVREAFAEEGVTEIFAAPIDWKQSYSDKLLRIKEGLPAFTPALMHFIDRDNGKELFWLIELGMGGCMMHREPIKGDNDVELALGIHGVIKSIPDDIVSHP